MKKHIGKLISRLKPQKIFCGFSGGADSLALLHALKEERKRLDFILEAIHFQHHLRGDESEADADWCRLFCENHSIPFNRIDLRVLEEKAPGENIEAAARRMRLAEWQRLREDSNKTSIIALAQHADDRRENFFLRAFRGSNCSGLSSLRPIQTIGSTTFIRPFLTLDKTDLVVYLENHGIHEWREDSSNSDEHFIRNFLRNSIFPSLTSKAPSLLKGVTRSLKALDLDADFIERQADQYYSKAKTGAFLSRKDISNIHPAILPRIIRSWILDQTGEDIVPNWSLTSRIQHVIDQNTSAKQKITVNDQIEIVFHQKMIKIHKKGIEEPVFATWNWRESPEITWKHLLFTVEIVESHQRTNISLNESEIVLDADLVPNELIIREYRAGDSMIPFSHSKKVKLKKIFSDHKIMKEEKANIPVVCLPDSETIIWLPGVKRSTFAAIDSQTRSLVMISATHP